jgi:molecular chaperone DnaK
MVASPALGIDLGTTFSVMAYVNRDGRAAVIPNAEGERLTPSVVYLDGQEFVVGQAARNAGLADPDNMVEFVKRHMGIPDWRFRARGKQYAAPQVSAQIIRKLKTDAELALGTSIAQAVITVPYYFGEAQRRATRDAAEMARLEVLKLINEPTAAAIAYGLDRCERPETVLVHDLGGGTFDVTICRVDSREITVLATDGDSNLGGKDFDDRIIKFVAEQFQQNHGIDPRQDRACQTDLRERAVRAKHQLSTMERASIALQVVGKHGQIEITRQQFETLVRPLLVRIEMALGSALRSASVGYNDIDRVLLIGGASRMPMIKRMLSGRLGRPVEFSMNPDETVALGAAIEAARVQLKTGDTGLTERAKEEIANLVVFDVLSHSLGVQATRFGSQQPVNKIIIQRNSRIPCEVKETFYTSTADATSVRVVVYQGESEKVEDCLRVGEFVLSGLPPGRPRGMPVVVSIICNENGIVEVQAVDQQTGTAAQTTVNYADSAT